MKPNFAANPLAMFLSVVWATHTVTKARGDVSHMTTIVRQLSDTADTRTRDRLDERER